MGWGRKTSTFCDRCAETFPDLVDGVCADDRLHQRVRRRLAEHPLCQRCFETYQRTSELCRHVVRDTPGDAVDLLARLRSKLKA